MTIKTNHASTRLPLGLIVFLLMGAAKKKIGRNKSEQTAYIRELLGAPVDETGDEPLYTAAALSAIVSPLFNGDAKTAQSEKLRKLTADADLAQHKAKLAQIRLQKEKDEVFDSDIVKEYLAGLGGTVKGAFGGLGSALALQLSTVSDAREIKALIDKKVNVLLKDIISEYALKNYKLKNKIEETTDDEEDEEE